MRRAVAALALLAIAGSACSSVPRSGKATEIGLAPTARAADTAQGAPVRRTGTRRAADATPAEVVRGFLDAEADTSKEGIALAQDYLTTPSVWDADAEALVYTTKDVTVEPSADPRASVVRVSYQLLARITTDRLRGVGEYRPDVRRIQQTFEVTRPEGEWKIAGVPSGRRINESDLAQVFRRVVPYHYANRMDDTLVPDPVYLLKRSTNQIQRVVQQLLDGPTPVLKDFLPPPLFPPGTKLLTASDPDNNIVEVTFNSELGTASQVSAQRIVAQIVWTLTAMDSGIDAVRIKIGDRPFVFDQSSGQAAAQRQADFKAFDPDAAYGGRTSYFNLEGTLGRYRPSSALRSGRTLGEGTGELSVDGEATTVAVTTQVGNLHELRVGPIAGDGPLVPQLTFERLTKPSWGTSEDGVWVATQTGDEPPKLFIVPADDRNNRSVTSSELGDRVYAFEVAPDGVRVAAIIERDGARSLELGYIDRSAFDAQPRVGGFRPVVDGRNLTATSVAWLDSGKLAFIGQRGEETPQVFTVLVDGTDLVVSPGSREVLQQSRPAPAPAPQLVPLAVRNDSASRGDNSTPDPMMVVIDGTAVYINRGAVWPRLSDRSRNN